MAEINFFWDPLSDNILQERNDVGVVTGAYTIEPSSNGNVINQSRSGVDSQFHFDAEGSALTVTDIGQAITDTRAYTAFGETTETAGSTSILYDYLGQHGAIRAAHATIELPGRSNYRPELGRWMSLQPTRPATLSVHASAYAVDQRFRFSASFAPDPSSRSSGQTDCLPHIPPAERIPNNCGAAFHGRDTLEDSRMCSTVERFVGGNKANALCRACSHADLIDLVTKTRCCHLLVNGHRGNAAGSGYENGGGIVNYGCRDHYGDLRCPRNCPCGKERGPRDACAIFPDSAFEDSLSKVFKETNGCPACMITIHSCGSGVYAGPLVDIARHTSCIVCGYASEGCPQVDDVPSNPTEDERYRCVNKHGQQVGGTDGLRFCGDRRGNPPGLNRPKEKCTRVPGPILF